MHYDRLRWDFACSCAEKRRGRENAGNAISPGGNGVDGHGGYTYSSSYTKNKCGPPQARAPTSRTRLNPHAGALPQKSTHQLRSCSSPEVHTISKVQKACFPWGLALMIASVPARSQLNRPKRIGLSRENSHHFTFFTCYPILFWEKLFARGFGRCSRVEYAAK